MNRKIYKWWWLLRHRRWKDGRQKRKALEAAMTKRFGSHHCKYCEHRGQWSNMCWCAYSTNRCQAVGDYHHCRHFKKVLNDRF